MSLTFIFRQGLSGKHLFYGPVINPPTPRASVWGWGVGLGPVIKTFAWKSLTKNKGKAHIYEDVFVMGSIYVMKSRFYQDYSEIRGTLEVSPLVFSQCQDSIGRVGYLGPQQNIRP